MSLSLSLTPDLGTYTLELEPQGYCPLPSKLAAMQKSNKEILSGKVKLLKYKILCSEVIFSTSSFGKIEPFVIEPLFPLMDL